jgi:thiol-disulfide isomerase/thioredoxin
MYKIGHRAVHLFLVILLLSACGAAAGQQLSSSKPAPGPFKGRQAPELSLENLHGQRVSLSQHQGKPVLINFWASWCPPCRQEMPTFQEIHQEYGDQVIILAVNATSTDNLENVREFVSETGVSFPILLDSDGLIQKSYGITALPTTIFVDTNGVVYERLVGPANKGFFEERIRQMKSSQSSP